MAAGPREHRRWTGPWPVLATGLVAAVPVIAATVQALALNWTPSSDAGVIALRAYDVLSEHPPLLGQYSQSSPLIGETTYSPGPMLYWVLALPARLAPEALIVTLAAISVASVMGVVALAARRGGPLLMLAAAVAMALVARSLPVETPYELWNCWAGIYPLTLLLFVGWSVGCGDFRLLPLLALVASYVAQAHLTYVLPVLAVVAVAAAGLVLWRRRAMRGAPVARWAIAAALVGVVCWSAPVIDQLRERPGNFVLAYRLATADEPRAGIEAGGHALARAVGVRPWWTLTAPTPVQRITDVTERPPWLMIASAFLVVAGLVVALVLALLRRRQDVAVAAALSLALCASVALVAASIPSELRLVALLYVLSWASPAGMFSCLCLAWSAWLLSAPALPSIRRPRPALALLGFGALAVAAAAAANRPGDDPNRQPPTINDYELVRDTTERVREALHGARRVMIDVPRTIRVPRGSYAGLTFQSAIAFDLRRAGVTVAVPPRVAREMGDSYLPDGRPYDAIVGIVEPGAPIRPASRILARDRQFTITLSRPGERARWGSTGTRAG